MAEEPVSEPLLGPSDGIPADEKPDRHVVGVRQMADRQGRVTDQKIVHLRRRAEGGLGWINLGYAYQLLRALDMPAIKTIILRFGGADGTGRRQGVGGASVVPVSASVARRSHGRPARPTELPLMPEAGPRPA